MERYEALDHESRLILIEALTNSKDWSLLTTIESKDNTYYLFQSRIDGHSTIAVNNGASDFYEDVIFNQ